jgi:hypothetical protein
MKKPLEMIQNEKAHYSERLNELTELASAKTEHIFVDKGTGGKRCAMCQRKEEHKIHIAKVSSLV